MMGPQNMPNNLQTNKQTAFPPVKKSSGLFLVTAVLDPSLISAEPFLPPTFLCFPLYDTIQIVTRGVAPRATYKPNHKVKNISLTNICHTKHERSAWLNTIVTVVAYLGDVRHDLYRVTIL